MKKTLYALLAATTTVALSNSSICAKDAFIEFTPEGVERTIRAAYEDDNYTVNEVAIIPVTGTHMVGFIRVAKHSIKGSLTCVADLGLNNNIIWSCTRP